MSKLSERVASERVLSEEDKKQNQEDEALEAEIVMS